LADTASTAKARSTRKKKDHDEAARARIITAARHRFASVGVEGASTRQIAEAAGVAQSLLLYYFKSKEALWKAVMDDLFATLRSRNIAANVGNPSEPPDVRLINGIRSFIDFCREDADLHRLMTIEGRRKSERMTWLADTHLREMYEAGVAAIRDGQAAGRIRKADPTLLYYTIISIVGSAYSFTPEMSTLAGKTIDPDPDEVEMLVRAALLKNA